MRELLVRANGLVVAPAAFAHLACRLLNGNGNAIGRALVLAVSAVLHGNVGYGERLRKLRICGQLLVVCFVSVQGNVSVDRLTDNARRTLLLERLQNVVAYCV